MHGTFWVSYPKEVAFDSLIAHEVSTMEETPVQNVAEFLKANVGKEVVIIPTGGENAPSVKGKLLSVAEDKEMPRPDPYGWGRSSADQYNRGYGYPPQAGRLALVQTSDGVVSLDTSNIRQATVVGDKPSSSIAKKSTSWEIVAHLKQPAAGSLLTASYLAKGITWAPSYVVDISDSKKAVISAKAEVINEAENLAGVHLDLISGFPNLQFANVVSPMAGKDSLAGFLSSLANGSSPQGSAVMSNVMAQSQSGGGYMRRSYDESGVMPQYMTPAAGQSIEDLFLYPVEQVSLKKGETGYYPLFSAKVPYTQIYTWEIPDYINQEDQYGNPQREGKETQEVVWHSIRLTNSTKIPWTTAPAQTVKANQLLGQDTLTYTSSTAETKLRITRAMGIKAEQNEYETKRKQSALEMYGSYFDKVSLEGKLRIINYKSEAVNVEITKILSGEVTQSTPEAVKVGVINNPSAEIARSTPGPSIKKLARGLSRMNPVNELTWSFTLKPGEEKEITYTYDALIRR